MLEQVLQIDTNFFLWLNSHHSSFWDPIMWFISGKIQWLPLYLTLIAYIIYKYGKESTIIFIAIIIAITIADQLSVKAFKEVFERLRPSHNPELSSIIHIVNNYKGGAYGFISNHAANSFSLALFLLLLFRNKYFSFGILFWASLVSYSRIYLGVHYPGDILGGAIFGSGIGCIVYFFYAKIRNLHFLNRLRSS